ncbi:condensin complex subunit SMC2 [Calocera viscosa TUFC12733]|uniref:Structural maintenance of chromosomes protein n=1 Tax=Calocera viscosa (strain TUFC12733) TaxID=1330018 RepID=A0A167HS15_CALVF|nr:condensin complex subunit SMC2 [Calocera viscosa TUFC12733]
MRIEELVLEGFKSYPVRTTITGWDPSFNAITGLNGSGKSNILDAICFVLGITNLQAVRATSQADLIYKKGQAGISKASVTVVFDNSDRSTSPVGFEDLGQITVTRQIALPNISKYLLNGHKATVQQIQNLFQSVQLNVNNPNFLIMQGKITKVLNMKPQEVLGMVEEASGTRMFEDRKEKAIKTIAKKEKRVEEITSILNEEITPKLDKLREEKRSFLAYQKTSSELERLSRLLTAYEWTDRRQREAAKAAAVEKNKVAVASAEASKLTAQEESKRAEAEKTKVEKARDQELKKSGKFSKLEEEVKSTGTEVVRLSTQMDMKQGSVKEEEGRVKELEAGMGELTAGKLEKEKEMNQAENSFADTKKKHDELAEKVSTNSELLQTLLTGLSTNKESTSSGYLGRLSQLRQQLATLSSSDQQGAAKQKMLQAELKTKEGKMKEGEKEGAEGRKALEKMTKEVERLSNEVEKEIWGEQREKELDERRRACRARVAELAEQRDALRSKLSALEFNYTPPSANFDTRKVHGLVAKLVNLPASSHASSTALEIAAGGRLYNVVVEDEKVGSDLLQKGQLKKRVTIIPLNKINQPKIPTEKLNAANKIAPGKVNVALSLVGYENEVKAAMSYVFGDTLICADSASAQAVTFARQVGMKSVTLEGDVYDPSGTLSGGSKPSGSGLLVKVMELKECEGKLQEAERSRAQVEKEWEQSREKAKKWEERRRELEIKTHEMSLLEERVSGGNAAMLKQDVDNIKQSLKDIEAGLKESKQKQKEAEAEISKIEKDMEEFKGNKEGKIKELKGDIAKQKEALNKQSVALKTVQKDMQTAELELEQTVKDIESAQEEVEEAKSSVKKLQTELAALKKDRDAAQAKHDIAEAKLKKERETLTAFDEEIHELEEVIKAKQDDVQEAELEMKRLEHESAQLQKDRTAALNAAQALEKQFPWILEEKKQFGKPGTPYDFKSVNVPDLRDRARELEQQQLGMKKKINPRVMSMIDDVEKKEVTLKKMMTTVLADKGKIEQTIAELDRYKLEALQKTWKKVNGDFGGIFAELLPGNFAKLEPPEGQDIMGGLEVKVRLGSVWKQSLTELSGGQRSLIALSLIMSLLQFKPAPMYILDEIDAALDLSHTQHIGQLFRSRFKGSQFIVVSLKEGLFTNANVLFRARFRDGTSIVERTAQRSTSALYDSTNQDHDAPERRQRGKAGTQRGKAPAVQAVA